jgi:DNA repair exonuclease SbcCD nuclease subunit
MALAEKVDLFLIAGDLFDSNTQPRRSVERVAGELARLAEARVRTVIIPGTHDVYDRSSIYRAYDLAVLAGTQPADEMVTVLTPERPWIHLAACDVVVHGPVFATKRAPHSPLQGLATVETPPATWKIGLLHATLNIPGRTDRDEVVITTDEIAASGLDYLALGHWHSAQVAKAGGITYAYAGAPEPVAVDQDRAGKVLLVTLDERGGTRYVTVDKRTVGRTEFQHLEVDAATVESQPALVTRLKAAASPDMVLDVRLIGVRRDELDVEAAEVEDALRGAFLRVRVRDVSRPALSEGLLPPPETIAGAFIRNVEGRIADLEASGDDPAMQEAEELRDVLRLGRLLLAGQEVTL